MIASEIYTRTSFSFVFFFPCGRPRRVYLPLLHRTKLTLHNRGPEALKATFSWKFTPLLLSLFLAGYGFPSWRKKSLLSLLHHTGCSPVREGCAQVHSCWSQLEGLPRTPSSLGLINRVLFFNLHFARSRGQGPTVLATTVRPISLDKLYMESILWLYTLLYPWLGLCCSPSPRGHIVALGEN